MTKNRLPFWLRAYHKFEIVHGEGTRHRQSSAVSGPCTPTERREPSPWMPGSMHDPPSAWLTPATDPDNA